MINTFFTKSKDVHKYLNFFIANNLYAQDLISALSDAFKNNSRINAERANLNASKQDLNISKGEFLPSITLSGDMATQKDTERTNYSGGSLQDTRAEPKSQSLLVEQKIFDGFTNFNDVRKAKLELKYSEIKLDKLEQQVLLEAAIAKERMPSAKTPSSLLIKIFKGFIALVGYLSN